MTSAFSQVFSQFRGGIKQQIDTSQNAGITTQTSGMVSPGWRTGSPYGDCTYPRILNLNSSIFGSTGAATTGTAHTHPLSGTGAQVDFGSYWTIAQNVSMGGYLTFTNTYTIDNILFIGYASTAMAGGSIDVELFREAADGSLTRYLVWSMTGVDVGTSAQNINLGFTAGDAFITRESERVLLRVVNRSSPARTYNIEAAPGALNIGSGTSLFPYIAHRTATSTDSNKTSYTAAEAATFAAAGATLPWFEAVRSSPPITDRTFSDDFNRINVGGQWNLQSLANTANMAIASGRLSYTGTANDTQLAVYIYPTSTDAMRVDADLWDLTSSGVYLYLCTDRDAGSYVALGVTPTAANIQTALSGTVTVRSTVSIDANDGATWSIYYEPTPKKYTVLKNGLDIGLTWTDSGSLVPHTVDTRYGGIGIARIGGITGGSADNFILRDWAPS